MTNRNWKREVSKALLIILLINICVDLSLRAALVGIKQMFPVFLGTFEMLQTPLVQLFLMHKQLFLENHLFSLDQSRI